MKHFPLLSDLFFGADTALCFKAAPEKIMRDYYFRTGQLCAVSILNSGRGTECLHPIIVRAIFDQPNNADHELEYIDDAEFNYKLEEIENKNYDALHDYNIVPSGNTRKDKHIFTISFVIYSRFQAIEQFKNAMKSFSSTLVLPENFNKVKRFILYSQVEMALYDFMLLCNIIHKIEDTKQQAVMMQLV